jgi:hypothetical protein
MEKRKEMLVSLSEYARRRGLSAKSVSKMAADGRISVAGKRGNALLVNPTQADRDRRANRLRVGGSERGLLAKAKLEALKVEFRIRCDRLKNLRGRYVDARAAGSARVEAIKVALAALDDLVRLQELERAVITAADGGAARVRAALSGWTRNLLNTMNTEMIVAAARKDAEVTTDLEAEIAPQSDTLAAWRVASLRLETLERRLRLEIAQRVVIDRDRSLASATETGVALRRAVESIGAVAVEVSEAAQAGADIIRKLLAGRLAAIRYDVERLEQRPSLVSA